LRLLLDQELNKLPDKFREAAVLCDVLGKSRKEVAEQLGIAEETLSSRLASARRK
jgi:RNA polymerase sigma factor (sigma-70 family)